ncbi:retrovirus-related pol polyprotein from transposon TNT 1-94 [Tanacetum coccineum]
MYLLKPPVQEEVQSPKSVLEVEKKQEDPEEEPEEEEEEEKDPEEEPEEGEEPEEIKSDLKSTARSEPKPKEDCEAAVRMTWEEFKALLVEEFCPSNEIEKMENEFWNHTMVGATHTAYTDRFHELAKLVPHLVTPKSKRIGAGILTDEAVKCGTLSKGVVLDPLERYIFVIVRQSCRKCSFEEVLVHQRLRKTLTHVLELSSCIYLCQLSMRSSILTRHRLEAAIVRKTCKYSINTACDQVEFKRISLTGFRSCTSRYRYQSVSKETTRHVGEDGNRTGKKEESKALVTVDGESIDWTTHSKDDEDYALMANNNSGSDIQDNPHRTLKNKGIIDSGCSRHMTGNKAYLADYQDINGGPVEPLEYKDILLGRRLGHVNFKNLNRLVKGNLVRGLPTKLFQNDHTCVACQKGKQHKASCKAKLVSSISHTLQLLHMDLFGPTSDQEGYSKARNSTTKWSCLVRKKGPLIEAARTNACRFHFYLTLDVAEQLDCLLVLTGYIRPFGCHVTILNTIDHLGKFAGKSDEGFLVGYSLQSKAFRVYNLVTKRVEENLHINFLENKPNVAGIGPNWLFDLDYLTDSMNYHNDSEEKQLTFMPGQQETKQDQFTKDKIDSGILKVEDETDQDCYATDGIFTHSSYDDEGAVADFTNLETVVNVSPIPTSRINPSHPSELILGDPTSAVQTRSKLNKSSETQIFFWVDAMQEELLQFEIQKVWILVNLPYGKKAIGTKWVYRNKKDERGVVVRNKARLVAQGHRQEEKDRYDEVLASSG